jgi:hypothetical protein
VLQPAVATYLSDFETGGDDFAGGFSITDWPGFDGRAIHSPHDYANGSNLVYLLTVPIRVAQANATVSFDEVVLVEPGEDGSEFGDGDFWDYVIVEASSDGVTWLPLADGYDSRDDAAWLAAWNSSQPGSQSLYRNRSLDLRETFAWNETVLLRFRLFADGFVNGWGWAIDNLAIQDGAVAAADLPAARAVSLAQNAPNPFNPSTTIRFALPRRTEVSLRVFDVRGRLVKTLADGPRPAGQHAVEWDGRNDRGAPAASGVYLYRLQAGEQTLQRRMLLVK